MDAKSLVAILVTAGLAGGGAWYAKDSWSPSKGSATAVTKELEEKIDRMNKALDKTPAEPSGVKISPESLANLSDEVKTALKSGNFGQAVELFAKLEKVNSRVEAASAKLVVDNTTLANFAKELKALREKADKEAATLKTVEEERDRLKLATSAKAKKAAKASKEETFQKGIIDLMLPYQEREQELLADLEAPHKAFAEDQVRRPEEYLSRKKEIQDAAVSHRAFMKPIEEESQKRLDTVRRKLEREYEWMRK